MATQTSVFGYPAGVPTNPTLGLTSVEKSWLFNGSPDANGIVRPAAMMTFVADAAWSLGFGAGGPYAIIPANTPFPISVPHGTTIYVKTGTTATLSAVVTG